MSLPDLRRFRTYKGNSVRDLLRAMRNKVSQRSRLQFCIPPRSGAHAPRLCLTRLTLCASSSSVTEASLSRAAPGRAGNPRRTAGRLCRLLHVAVPTVTDAHTRRHAHLQPRETVSPVLSDPQHQVAPCMIQNTASHTCIDVSVPRQSLCYCFCKARTVFGDGVLCVVGKKKKKF